MESGIFIILYLLKILQCGDMVDKKLNREYVLSTQGEFTGGFAKQPDTQPGAILLFNSLM